MNAIALVLSAAAVVLLIAVLARGSRAQTPASTADRDELNRTRAELQETQIELARVKADAAVRLEAAERRHQDTVASQEQTLREFQSLSAKALEEAQTALRRYAEERLQTSEKQASLELEQRRVAVEALVKPIQEQLGKVELSIQESEKQRAAAQGALLEQVRSVQKSAHDVQTETRQLVSALRKPQARGAWGEMQLRRVVEVAGMVDRVDFTEQSSFDTADGKQRPDLTVMLAGGKRVFVDAKVSLSAFLEAAESDDEDYREDRMRAHARHLKDHVKELSKKEYWSSTPDTPEFVVLFVPGESFLSLALDHEPQLMEDAAAAKIIIATPTILIALLRTIAYAWNQEKLADNAREIFELGKELHGRLSTMGSHLSKLGAELNGAVKAYNDTVGSLESRVLVTARKMQQLGGGEEELSAPSLVDQLPRQLSAPELVASADQSLIALPRAAAEG